MLQDKRKFFVQMAINLANKEEKEQEEKRKQEESILGEKTCLTDIQEEDSDLLWEHRK